LDGPLPKLCPAVALSHQDGRHSAVALLLKAALIQVSDYRFLGASGLVFLIVFTDNIWYQKIITMGRDRCRRGYFMANKTKNQRSSFFKKLNSERKITFFLDPKLHAHNLYTEPCTRNLLDWFRNNNRRK
jgi:hypothetical protein